MSEDAGEGNIKENKLSRKYSMYGSSQALKNKAGKQNGFSSLAQKVDAGMFSSETNMLSLLSSVTTSIADSEQECEKAKKLEEIKKSDSQTMRTSLSSSSSSSSSSNDEDEDSDAESSDLDEEDCDRIRSQCLDEMSNIEKQFTDIRDQLFRERYSQITNKLKEVESETAPEYLHPFNVLSRNKDIRIEVCELLKDMRKESINCWHQAQKQSNEQHFENEKNMMVDSIRAELEEKIKILEEDRDNVDLSTELWTDATWGNGQKYRSMSNGSGSNRSSPWQKSYTKKLKRDQPFHFGISNGNSSKRKKKAVTVTGPYIVYMLRDNDILDDWAVIKRALTASKRRKSGFKERTTKTGKHHHSCRIENNKLKYDGRWYQRGQGIMVKSKDTGTLQATITSVTNNEVTAKQVNGTITKMHIQQLIRGKYVIKSR